MLVAVVVDSSGAPYVVIAITSPGIIVTSLYRACKADTGVDDPPEDASTAGPANCPHAAAPSIIPHPTAITAFIDTIEPAFIRLPYAFPRPYR